MKRAQFIKESILLRLIIALGFIHTSLWATTFYLPQEERKSLEQRYGSGATKRVDALLALMNTLIQKTEKEKLIAVNNFFNQVRYASDQQVWNRSDYWANRMEFLGKGAGDCEDYAYAKYFTLKQLGVVAKQMRAFYCTSLTYNQPHLVLAYFKEGKKIPFILGNYHPDIMPANLRKDLKPIKLYNSEALFIAKLKKMGKTVPGTKSATLKWIEIINGIRKKKDRP